MAYFFTIVFVLFFYLRPFEWSNSVREYPVLQVVAGIGFLSILLTKLTKGYRISENRVDLMMIGFMVSIGLSHVSHGWFGGAMESMGKFLPALIGYFLIAHSLDSETKMESFITVLIICSVALAIAGIVQYHTGSPVAGAEALVQRDYSSGNGIVHEFKRIRWHGPFSDPNDLAIAFVLIIPFLMYCMAKGKYLLSGLSLPTVAYALHLTNSRGAFLALIVAVTIYFFISRKGFKGFLIAVVIVGLIALIGPSRIGDISASEGSAHGRLDAWYEGFQILKQNPIFGSGAMSFTEFNDLTAHNSLVLVFSELGLFGAFFFVGMFYGSFELLKPFICGEGSDTSLLPNRKYIFAALIASLTGVIISIFFLSRSYTFLPYMVLAIVLAGTKLHWNTSTEPQHMANRSSLFQFVRNIVFVQLGMIIFINLILKVLL